MSAPGMRWMSAMTSDVRWVIVVMFVRSDKDADADDVVIDELG